MFDLEAFKSAGPKKFVLVEIDFPQDKSKLARETQEQNAKLQQQFGRPVHALDLNSLARMILFGLNTHGANPHTLSRAQAESEQPHNDSRI